MRCAGGLLVAAIGLTVGSCNGLTDPVPTYFGVGQVYGSANGPIQVRVDPRYMTLETRLPPEQVVLQALQCGAAICRVTPYPVRPFHYYVRLPPRSSIGEAEHFARVLRQTPGVDFASAAYLSAADSTCIFAFYNSLVVQFKPGVAQDTIARVNAIAGTRTDPDHPTYSSALPLLYPRGDAHSPIEVSVYYGRRPSVLFVSPGTTGCFDGHVYTPDAGTAP